MKGLTGNVLIFNVRLTPDIPTHDPDLKVCQPTNLPVRHEANTMYPQILLTSDSRNSYCFISFTVSYNRKPLHRPQPLRLKRLHKAFHFRLLSRASLGYRLSCKSHRLGINNLLSHIRKCHPSRCTCRYCSIRQQG